MIPHRLLLVTDYVDPYTYFRLMFCSRLMHLVLSHPHTIKRHCLQRGLNTSFSLDFITDWYAFYQQSFRCLYYGSEYVPLSFIPWYITHNIVVDFDSRCYLLTRKREALALDISIREVLWSDCFSCIKHFVYLDEENNLFYLSCSDESGKIRIITHHPIAQRVAYASCSEKTCMGIRYDHYVPTILLFFGYGSDLNYLWSPVDKLAKATQHRMPCEAQAIKSVYAYNLFDFTNVVVFILTPDNILYQVRGKENVGSLFLLGEAHRLIGKGGSAWTLEQRHNKWVLCHIGPSYKDRSKKRIKSQSIFEHGGRAISYCQGNMVITVDDNVRLSFDAYHDMTFDHDTYYIREH